MEATEAFLKKVHSSLSAKLPSQLTTTWIGANLFIWLEIWKLSMLPMLSKEFYSACPSLLITICSILEKFLSRMNIWKLFRRPIVWCPQCHMSTAAGQCLVKLILCSLRGHFTWWTYSWLSACILYAGICLNWNHWWFDQIQTLGEGPLPTYGFNHTGNNEAVVATWILLRGEHYPFLDNICSYHL